MMFLPKIKAGVVVLAAGANATSSRNKVAMMMADYISGKG